MPKRKTLKKKYAIAKLRRSKIYIPARFEDVSSEQQIKNGTLCLKDTEEEGIYYISYPKGNVRREMRSAYITADGEVRKLKPSAAFLNPIIDGVVCVIPDPVERIKYIAELAEDYVPAKDIYWEAPHDKIVPA
jgi:hypothetical protein